MTTSGVTLADKLRLKDLPLATTPGGKNFVLKALHPSEHTIKSARVPGGNELSVALCSDQVYTFPITHANSGMDILLTPNVIIPASCKLWSDGDPEKHYNMYNAAFGGTVVENPNSGPASAMIFQLSGLIRQYRITAQSVTVELIAPTLTDQGTITAFQGVNPPLTGNLSTFVVDGSNPITAARVGQDILVYPELPDSSSGILGSSAYTSKARDGCYMPLKLQKFKWYNFSDRAIFMSWPGVDPVSDIPYALNCTNALDYPYYEARGNLVAWKGLPSMPKLCGDTYGKIVVAGLAAGVSLRIRVRQVIEIVVPPGTTYAPLVEVSLPPDELALRMYKEISARMMDAYPASYNDLGKLFSTIKGMAQKILPFVDPLLEVISKMPGYVGDLGEIGKGVATLAKEGVQIARKRRKKRQQGKDPGTMQVQAHVIRTKAPKKTSPADAVQKK